MELLRRNNNRPGLAGVAEHLLGFEELTLFKNHVPYALGWCGGGVKDFLDSVDEGHGDLGRFVIGPALDLDSAAGIGLLGLGRVALCQELQARRRAWVQRIELDSHSG